MSTHGARSPPTRWVVGREWATGPPQQAVVLEELVGDVGRVLLVDADFLVQLLELVGGERLVHLVEGGGEVRRRLVGPYDRDDVVGGLELLVVVEHDQALGRHHAVGAEDQPDADLPLLDRVEGQRAAGIERPEALEPRAVGLLQPWLAERPLRAFRRAAEHELALHVWLAEVGQPGQAVPVGGRPRDGERVLVGGRGVLVGDQLPPFQQRLESLERLVRVTGGGGGRLRVLLAGQERRERAEVIRHEVDLAVAERLEIQLAVAEVELGLDVVAGLAQHVRVHVRDDHVLGEVRRGDRDRALAPGGGRTAAGRGAAVAGAAGGQGRHRDREGGGEPSWCTHQGKTPPSVSRTLLAERARVRRGCAPAQEGSKLQHGHGHGRNRTGRPVTNV